VGLSAEDEIFPITIDDANDATANFIWINPIFDIGGTVCCRTSKTPRFVSSARIDHLDHLDLAATYQFVAAPTKSSVV